MNLIKYGCVSGILLKSSVSLGPLRYFENDEMNVDLFESLFLNGSVAVIRGASLHWPLTNWSCEDFRKHPSMKEHKLERVYGENDGSFVTLCDTCDQWEHDKRASYNDDKTGPQFAPLFWDVKTDPSGKKAIHEQTPIWSFVSKANTMGKFHGVELWFSPPKAGAKYHIDGHLQMTVVNQMTGTRRWRLASIPDESDRPSLIPAHLDSNKYDWIPEHEFVLNTGDMLIFPPGSIHDTLNIGENCAVSVTHQLNVPLPARFYRRNLASLLSMGDTRESWPPIADLASFGFLRPRATMFPPYFESHPEIHLTYIESDPLNFFEKVFRHFFPHTRGPFGSKQEREYIAFHDRNEDGVITEEEFLSTVMEWLYLEDRIMSHVLPKFRPARFFYSKMKNLNEIYWSELSLIEGIHRAQYNKTGNKVILDIIEDLKKEEKPNRLINKGPNCNDGNCRSEL